MLTLPILKSDNCPIVIEDEVWIGANAALTAGATIGAT